ncbi:hypothetical protein SAMN05661093_05263 [Kibdelosporangium aridum]|uniref:Uncharacterized protein n=1 Tax=Kibdelosporangium aridum TaxID=2030 RepID=A0A1W2F096_KIBAR|nr:hypothetical protein SAMN05661093_05263 [Kibdelosporangium aridum]
MFFFWGGGVVDFGRVGQVRTVTRRLGFSVTLLFRALGKDCREATQREWAFSLHFPLGLGGAGVPSGTACLTEPRCVKRSV